MPMQISAMEPAGNQYSKPNETEEQRHVHKLLEAENEGGNLYETTSLEDSKNRIDNLFRDAAATGRTRSKR